MMEPIIAIEPFESGLMIGQSVVKCQSKVVPRDVCEHLPNLTGCHSNVPWATAK